MDREPRPIATAVVLCGAWFAASPASAMALDPGRCDDARAARLVGAAAPSDAEARRISRAGVVRRIRPGQPVTMEFSASRVTLEIADGKVVAARCG